MTFTTTYTNQAAKPRSFRPDVFQPPQRTALYVHYRASAERRLQREKTQGTMNTCPLPTEAEAAKKLDFDHEPVEDSKFVLKSMLVEAYRYRCAKMQVQNAAGVSSAAAKVDADRTRKFFVALLRDVDVMFLPLEWDSSAPMGGEDPETLHHKLFHHCKRQLSTLSFWGAGSPVDNVPRV